MIPPYMGESNRPYGGNFADDCRSVDTAAWHYPTMLRLSGISELAPLRMASRIIPAIAHLRYPLGRLRVAGWRIASLTRSVVKIKIPAR